MTRTAAAQPGGPADAGCIERVCADERQTLALAATVARAWQPEQGGAQRLYLRGPLGSGKTTWARAALQALGVTRPVRSPTYALIETYDLPDRRVLHADLYRLAAAEHLAPLGLEDYDTGHTLWLVEWPERGGQRLPPADLDVELLFAGDGRRVRLRAASPGGARWLARAIAQGA